ncbi:hypothetical protein TNCV_5130871 [Trichonephila clavipes]|nr:hypothetical protein TNCV_5130871 [Trichonephila clavipes]
MTSAQNIANELLSPYNVSVSVQTVRNVLHSAGLKARTPRKKPYIRELLVIQALRCSPSEVKSNEQVKLISSRINPQWPTSIFIIHPLLSISVYKDCREQFIECFVSEFDVLMNRVLMSLL